MSLFRTFIFLVIALLVAPVALANSGDVKAPLNPDASISSVETVFERYAKPWTLPAAQAHFAQGNGEIAPRDALTLGIGSNPVWVKVTVHNAADSITRYRLNTGVTWINSLDLYTADQNGGWLHRKSGDGQPVNNHFLPGIGLVFDVYLQPGPNQIYIRAETDDPLTMPIKLQPPGAAQLSDSVSHMAYGLLYGILLTLIGYNLILVLTFRQKSALYYSIYIGCFIVLNTGYSGFGYAWLYSGSTHIQNYSTLLFMVLHGCAGLLFASSFLALKQHVPRLYRGLLCYIASGVILILLLITFKAQALAALFAFSYLSATSLLMILVGVLNYKRVEDSGYYLLAVSASMLGIFITAISVWGRIPFTSTGFHAAEIGVVCEAIILAAILAKQLKAKESERVAAKYLSSHDPLTNLRNRRSFLEQANNVLSVATRSKRPVSLIMIDIDHFKSINDQHGHRLGDLALVHFADLLKKNARECDLVARWGGEEIVLLLPETDLQQAVAFAERLRGTMAQSPASADGTDIAMTASFGVAFRARNETLDELFEISDKQLYRAKSNGRNCVEPSALG